MEVSIIIVNYNTRVLTTNCIRSVYEKTKSVSFEIILVDNNSSECSASVFKEEFPNICIIENKANIGFARGNNAGIEKASGTYVLLLNSDTELVNDAISIAVKQMQNDTRIGALSAQLIYPDGRPQPVAARFPSLKIELLEFLRVYKFESKQKKSKRLHGDLWDYSKPVETDWVWGAFLLMPAAVLKQFPDQKLHDDFFMYFEDVQWCYFIKKNLNLKIVYIPDGVVVHHIAGSSKIKDHWINFKTKILPNQYKFLLEKHGSVYTYMYYLVKALHYFTLKGEVNKMKAKEYLEFIRSRYSDKKINEHV